MKTKLFALLFILSFTIISTSQAQDRGFGIGAIIGTPDGVSLKNWVSENTALAGAVSFSIGENSSTFYTHIDYLYHQRYSDLEWEIGYLTYYYGGGARVFWQEIGPDNTFFALRLPAGFNFNLTDMPIDFFFELAPTFNVAPDFNFVFNGGIGFRYFLN